MLQMNARSRTQQNTAGIRWDVWPTFLNPHETKILNFLIAPLEELHCAPLKLSYLLRLQRSLTKNVLSQYCETLFVLFFYPPEFEDQEFFTTSNWFQFCPFPTLIRLTFYYKSPSSRNKLRACTDKQIVGTFINCLTSTSSMFMPWNIYG